jgi:hypothetical protein
MPFGHAVSSRSGLLAAGRALVTFDGKDHVGGDKRGSQSTSTAERRCSFFSAVMSRLIAAWQ